MEFGIQGAYTLADDIEQSLAVMGINEPVLGIPPLEVRSRLGYTGRSAPFFGEFEMRNVRPQDRVAVSRLEAPSPGFTTLGLRGGMRLPKRLSLEAGVENLGDKFYFEHLNSLNPFTRAGGTDQRKTSSRAGVSLSGLSSISASWPTGVSPAISATPSAGPTSATLAFGAAASGSDSEPPA